MAKKAGKYCRFPLKKKRKKYGSRKRVMQVVQYYNRTD